MKWITTPSLRQYGFVQARLMHNHLELAEIEFHAPIYYVNLTRHVAGYVDNQLNGPAQFRSLEEAKAWATVVCAMNH
jgi:hypothetical protein